MAKANNLQARVKKLSNSSIIAGLMVLCMLVLVFSILISKELWADVRFNSKVISKKNAANKTLEENVEALDELKTNYEALQKEGPDSKKVLEALPTEVAYDTLGAEFESMAARSAARLASITLDSFETDPSAGGVQQVEFRATATGPYVALQAMLASIEHSTRPMQVISVSFSGVEPAITADFTVITFFQPPASVEPQTEVIKL